MQAYADRPLGQALSASYGKWTTSGVMAGYVGDVTQKLVFVGDEDAQSEQEATESRAWQLSKLVENHEELAGNGLGRLEASVQAHTDVFDTSNLSNPVPLTEKQVKKLGDTERHLEMGPFTYCFYEQSTALCGGRGKADFRLCRPGVCHNSVMTPGQLAAVELRRRADAALHPVLARDKAKIEEYMGELLVPYEPKTDNELREIIRVETSEYLNVRVGTPKVRQP